MLIPLRTEMIRDLIARRFGSVDGLVVEWEERVRASQSVRHGYLPAREVQAGIGTVAVKVPLVRDRAPES